MTGKYTLQSIFVWTDDFIKNTSEAHSVERNRVWKKYNKFWFNCVDFRSFEVRREKQLNLMKKQFRMSMSVCMCVGKIVAKFNWSEKPTAIHDHRLLMAHDRNVFNCIHIIHPYHAHVKNHHYFRVWTNALANSGHISFHIVLVVLILVFFLCVFCLHQLQLHVYISRHHLHGQLMSIWNLSLEDNYRIPPSIAVQTVIYVAYGWVIRIRWTPFLMCTWP